MEDKGIEEGIDEGMMGEGRRGGERLDGFKIERLGLRSKVIGGRGSLEWQQWKCLRSLLTDKGMSVRGIHERLD